MRFTTTSSVLICALMASSVIADNCKKGLYYCGSGLLNKGKYYDQISAALVAAGQPTDNAHVTNSLFFCLVDKNTNGNINFTTFCANGCQDGGEGNSDYCI
ncbi:hypothetical protein CPB83DRAFT_852339 [Crepidotus variabilis]|uniref:Uncharacterized protein n=1 Tax=Crepidotus variabilis TaxID=179855 RepID=A0A9P6EIA0_9AGAR|nr:hypothetical protein CPB83DRAFT_852339 [Crepidotus variabilis]